MKIKVPVGMEVCNECGGDGGMDAASFGDYGWHPCFKCGMTGYLPVGTADREEETARLMDRLDPRPRWVNQDAYD